MFFKQTVGTARKHFPQQTPAQNAFPFPAPECEEPAIFAVPGLSKEPEEPPKPPPTQRPLLHLSEAAAAFMAIQEGRGLATRSVNEYRLTLWSIVEFFGCDAPRREWPSDTCVQYLRWLRSTPACPRYSKTLPRKFSKSSLSAFFSFPPRRKLTNKPRSEQTVGRYWRTAEPFFEFVGLATAIEDKRDKLNLELCPPLVPTWKTVKGWWRDALGGPIPPPPSRRRQVVLCQALVYLTGMRIDEALEALVSDIEEHYLLIRESKTHKPRIVYLNEQALGIIAELHRASRQMSLFDAGPRTSKYLLAWDHTQSFWHQLVRECKGPGQHDPSEKRHQLLRRKAATWLHKRDDVVESAQLGHGNKSVQVKHYLDVLRLMPKVLEKCRLPPLGLPGFEWPAPVSARLRRPERLYAEFRKLIMASRRRS